MSVVTEGLAQEWEKDGVTWTLNTENKWAGKKRSDSHNRLAGGM